MDDFKKKNINDFDDIEVIDATDGDVIEIVDPFESEVIEVPIEKEPAPKKKSAPHVAQAPSKKIMDSDFDIFNPSTTVILKKAPADEQDKDKEKKSSEDKDVKPVKEEKIEGVIPDPKPDIPSVKPVVKKGPVSVPPTGKIPDVDHAAKLYNAPTPSPAGSDNADKPKKPIAPPSGKIQDIDFGALEGYDSNTVIKKAEPKPEEKKETKEEVKKPETGARPAVNTALAGAKPAASASRPATSASRPSPERDSSDALRIKPTERNNKGIVLLGKEITPKVIIIAAASLIALILIIVLINSGSGYEINLKKFTTVTYDGFEGSAVPVVTIDYDGIAKEYGSKIKVSSSDSLVDILKRDIEYSLSKTGELNTGDNIQLNLVVNNKDFEKVTNGTLKGGEMSVKVGNLPVLTNDFDPFDGMTFAFDGYSGEGTITITAPEGAVPGLLYVPSVSEGLYNGQDLKIGLAVDGQDDVDQYLRSKGYGAISLEKAVKVEGLKEYELYDLFGNVSVSFAGIDGIGNATVNGSCSYSDITFVLKKDSGLSNGDKVVVKAETASGKPVREVLLADKLSVATDEMEFEVEGLAIPSDYDPFNELEIKYTGIAPDGILSIDSSAVSVSGLQFSADKISGLANGDEITITVSCSASDDPAVFCLERGRKLVSTSRTFKVEKLSQYMTSFDQIDNSANMLLDAASRSIMNDTIAGFINEDTIDSITLDSVYIQYPKSDKVQLAYNLSLGGDIHNRLFAIYKIHIVDGAYDFDYFWPIEFANIIINGDGEIVVNTRQYIAALNEFNVGGRAYYGYQQMSDFTTSIIDTAASVYDYAKK